MVELNSVGRFVFKECEESTNNWQTIYEETNGTRFRHFKAVLYTGKVYCYAMRRTTTGKAQPIDMIIYDLNNDPKLLITAPNNKASIILNDTINLIADAHIPGGSISRVNFSVNLNQYVKKYC